MRELIRVKNYKKVAQHGLFRGYGANVQGHIICIDTGKPCEITVIFGNLRYVKIEDERGQFVSIRTDRFVWQFWQRAIPSGLVTAHTNGQYDVDSIGNLGLAPLIYKEWAPSVK